MAILEPSPNKAQGCSTLQVGHSNKFSAKYDIEYQVSKKHQAFL